MKNSHEVALHRINSISSEMDALYHQSSLRFGITDSVSIVLYNVYDAGGECLLSEIYKTTGVSKQTVNSAVRTLERDGTISLRRHDGRTKKIILTEAGKAFAERTVARLYCAENAAFDSWSEDEIKTYIRLSEKYLDCLRREIGKL